MKKVIPLPGRRWKVHKMGGDDDIRDAVEDQLTFDPDVEAAESHITVETMNGEATLNGTVPSYPQYLAAEAAARRVAGVKDVHNHLEVVLPPGDYRDDQTLTTMANDALTLNDTVRVGVEAAAADGVITLTGTVRYRSACGGRTAGCRAHRCTQRQEQHPDSRRRGPADVTVKGREIR